MASVAPTYTPGLLEAPSPLRAGGHTVAPQIRKPGIGRAEFDLLVVSKHDRLCGPVVIASRAAVHRAAQTRLTAERCRFPALATMPRPIASALIRRTNRAYRSTPRRGDEIAEALAGVLRNGGDPVLITPSRRTGAAGLALLQERLGGFSRAIRDGSGENPYFAHPTLTDAALVNGDSVSMVREAAAIDKPVHVLDLDGGNGKFARFHEAMRAPGITRPFCPRIDRWSDPDPDDSTLAGTALQVLLLARRKRA